jgi:chemotaxis protein MotB
MANNLNATQAELVELRQQHADADKRLVAFKSFAEKLRKMIEAGKLEVTIRQGRMIVKLPAEILFASGSAQLSEAGHAPLKELAAVLKQFPDRRFMVGGHTDNIPIGPSSFKSNWELSTARAVTVTEFLASSGVNPSRLTAAGYSEYDPIRPTLPKRVAPRIDASRSCSCPTSTKSRASPSKPGLPIRPRRPVRRRRRNRATDARCRARGFAG